MRSINIKDVLKGILIVPLGLALVLVPFSLLMGWHLLTLFLFWFLLVPFLTYYLPTWFSQSSHQLLKSISGLLLFYGIMVLMIYEHYQSDYFQIMVISGIINVIAILLLSFTSQTRTPA